MITKVIKSYNETNTRDNVKVHKLWRDMSSF